MGPHTESDFLALKEQVTDGFAMNTLEHKDLTAIAEGNSLRSEKLDRILAEVIQFNKTISGKLFGNGAVGCMETQRGHAAFLKGIKKMIWIMGTVITGALVSGTIIIVKHVLATP